MIVRDDEQAEQERAEVAEQRNWVLIRERKAQEHERAMKQDELASQERVRLAEIDNSKVIAELEAKLGKAQAVSREKVLARRAIVLALIKFPALPFAVIFCWVLEQTGHDIPEALENFVSL